MPRLLVLVTLVGLGLLAWWLLQDGVSPVEPDRETGASAEVPAIAEEATADPAPPPTVEDPVSPDHLFGPGTVTGRVLSAEDHRPIGGVWIHAESFPLHGDGSSRESGTSSDEEGRYTLAGVGPGKVLVYAHGGGWVSTSLGRWLGKDSAPPPLQVPPGAVIEQDLLVERTGSIEVSIVKANGEPGTGYMLTASSDRFTSHCERLSGFRESGPFVDGVYHLSNLVPGRTYWLTCIDRLTRLGEPIRVQSGENARIRIQLPAELWLEVVVVDAASGAPIGDANVSAFSRSNETRFASGNSAPDGRTPLGPLVAGEYEVQAKRDGYVNERVEVELPLPSPLQLELVRGMTIAGRVKLAEGGAGELSSVWVLIKEMVGPARETPETGGMIRPLATNGAFHLSDLRPGTYQLEVLDRRTGKALCRVLADAGTTDVEIEIDEVPEPDPLRIIRATVVGPDGKPVRQAIFRLNYPGGSDTHRISEGKRGVRYTGEGPLRLEVHGAVGNDGAILGAGEFGPFTPPCEVELRLSPERPVAGMVVDQAGRPVSHVAVRAIPDPPDAAESLRKWRLNPDLKMHHATGLSGPDGRFTLGGLGKGAYLLLIEPPTRFAKIAPVPLAPGVTSISIDLGPDPR